MPGRGGLLPGGPGLGGVCLVWRGLLLGGVPGPGGVFSLPGGFSLLGRFSLPGGGVLPRETPPVNRITHTCKNITLAITSLRPVMTIVYSCLVSQINLENKNVLT